MSTKKHDQVQAAQFDQLVKEIDEVMPHAPADSQSAPGFMDLFAALNDLKNAFAARDISAIGKAWFALNDALKKMIYGETTDGGVTFAPQAAQGAWLKKIMELLGKMAPIILPLILGAQPEA